MPIYQGYTTTVVTVYINILYKVYKYTGVRGVGRLEKYPGCFSKKFKISDYRLKCL